MTVSPCIRAARPGIGLAVLAVAGCASSQPAPQPPEAAPPAASAPQAAAHAGHDAAASHDRHRHHGGMPHRFERAEDWAKSFDDPARDAWQRPDDVIAALELRPGMAIADVGAGTGYFTVRLARAVRDGQIIATDIEPDMVRYLTERARREGLANVRAVQAEAADPRLPPSSVDRILVVDVWHHIADRVRYATGLAAALRPGGRIAIVDFTATATHGPPARHRLAPDAIVADLRAAGLDASVSPVRLPEQYIVIGVRR
jgi:SAM-dependent methyltransferase